MKYTKIALVTGGTRGIGAAIAKKLAQNGYYVYINCRTINDNALQILETIQAEGNSGELIEFDVTDKNAIIKAVGSLALSHIDLLVNNAGILFDNLICDLSLDQWESVLNTNYWGSVNVFSSVYEKLTESSSRPTIINMGSISGVRPRKGQGAYSVSKSMIIEWTSQIVKNMTDKRLRTFCISPGPVETEMIVSSPWYNDSKSKKRIPMGRYAAPEEIADFVLFLSENPMVFKNGSNIILDGGLIQTIKEIEN